MQNQKKSEIKRHPAINSGITICTKAPPDRKVNWTVTHQTGQKRIAFAKTAFEASTLCHWGMSECVDWQHDGKEE